jgi:hypothetical protein
MKNLKVFILFMFILLIPYNVLAQSGEFKNSTPEQRAELITNWMKSKLALDPAVVTEVYNINLKYARIDQDVMSSTGGRFRKFKELKANGKSKDKELKAVFTGEQYNKYLQKKEELRKAIRERMKEKRNQ